MAEGAIPVIQETESLKFLSISFSKHIGSPSWTSHFGWSMSFPSGANRHFFTLSQESHKPNAIEMNINCTVLKIR